MHLAFTIFWRHEGMSLMAYPIADGLFKSHAAECNWRNASRPIIQPRSPCWPLTQAAKHSCQISRLQRQEATQQLKKAVTDLIAEQAIKADAIADAHSVKSKWVKALIVGGTNYGSKRKSQLYNALVSAKAQEVNSGKFLSSIFTTINSPPRSSGWGAPFPDWDPENGRGRPEDAEPNWGKKTRIYLRAFEYKEHADAWCPRKQRCRCTGHAQDCR